ncbi:leucine rich adaptor protein 1-like [Denticeps clupeoides]|uniref:Leucine rich adaptor protein 1-like n=1 Tax=Denticeps clupeoides TaxID=299321 RepID=A0AAY4AKJ2_9TELE|nr:leucine rich adaptor protein 1-like [Denticeps clupeoides]
MDEDNGLPDLKDIETKLGRKVPESLIRSLAERDFKTSHDKTSAIPALAPVTIKSHTSTDLKRLESKITFLKQEMDRLRSIDITLMHQLLLINEGIESIRWAMDVRVCTASQEGSLTGSLYSLTDSQDASQNGSCTSLQNGSEDLDGISVGSYLDTLGEDLLDHPSPTDLSDSFSDNPVINDDTLEKPPPRPRVDTDEYFIFG